MLSAGKAVKDVVVDAENVYWSDGNISNSILTCPLGGRGAGPKVLVTRSDTYPSQLAVDATAVCFTVNGTQTIFKVAK